MMMTLDERVAGYLRKCPPAISGHDGHGQTFKVASALVHGFALEPGEALRHLGAYNATCQPPWSEREMRHKIAEAGKARHQKPRGHLFGGPRPPIGPSRPRLVPLRLTARSAARFGTLGTLHSDLRANAGEKKHPLGTGGGSGPSQPSHDAPIPAVAVLPGAGVSVPGCHHRRPDDIDLADADWRAVEAAGLADAPLVLAALRTFGPGCRVLAAEAGS